MYRREIVWASSGAYRVTRLSSRAGAPNTFAALVALSHAAWLNWFEGELNVNTGAGQTFRHISVATPGLIQFRDSANRRARLILPAPIDGLLMADHQTFNTADSSWTDLQTQVTAELILPAYNSNATALVDGFITYQSDSLIIYDIVPSGSTAYARTIQFMDRQGHTILTRLMSRSGAGGTQGQMDAMSQSQQLLWYEGQIHVNASPSPSALHYSSVDASLDFVLEDAAGNQGVVHLPAPPLSLFYADQETPKLSVPALATLLTAMASELVIPSSGLAITAVRLARLSHRRIYGQY